MSISRNFILSVFFGLFVSSFSFGSNTIEEQLIEIGKVHNDEIVVVQRKYTRKDWRHELVPIMFGGIPFGTFRRTLFGGASYTLHLNDWLAFEGVTFLYSQTFFTSFTKDITANPEIKPDYQKLIYFLSSGFQISPFYGKLSTFSRWIAYIEPFISLGGGIAKTETNNYFTFYPGFGIRAFFKEWFSMRIELRDYIYSEAQAARSGGSSRLTNNYSVMLSLSFWIPKMPI